MKTLIGLMTALALTACGGGTMYEIYENGKTRTVTEEELVTGLKNGSIGENTPIKVGGSFVPAKTHPVGMKALAERAGEKSAQEASVKAAQQAAVVQGAARREDLIAKYVKGVEAFHSSDPEGMNRIMQEVVRDAPDFTEAWYYIGIFRDKNAHHLADQSMVNRGRVIAEYRACVEARKKALDGLAKNVYYVWDAKEREQRREDLEWQLQGVDAWINDDDKVFEQVTGGGY